jgi:hypothetical protein
MTDTESDHHAAATEQERRALDADELELADKARQPVLGKLSDRELSELVSRLRSRRNRARDIADRQGREARSKSDPSGATAASGNAGTLTKHDFLNAALARASDERATRGATDEDEPAKEAEAQPRQRELADKAMAMKRAGQAEHNEMVEDGGPLHPNDPDASEGKGNLADTARRTAPSGALDHAGELPSRERSRTRY